MFSSANWIWLSDDLQGANTRAIFRRNLTLDETARQARLAVTADARYWLWVNGTFVGQGPARSWPDEWSYDVYDLRPYLKAGENAIAVLVQHIGVGTFQSIAHRPGLLAELEWEASSGVAGRIGTDETWAGRLHEGYARQMPRISCQLAFAECYDARSLPPDWTTAPCGAEWRAARIIAPPESVQDGLWPRLVAREIPFLTEEPQYPVRLRESRLTRPVAAVWSMDLRPQFLGTALDANPRTSRGVLFTTVTVDESTPVCLGTRQSSLYYRLAVNGVVVPPRGAASWFDRGDVIETVLPAGENLLAFIIDVWAFEWSLNALLEPLGLTPALPGDGPARFAFAGPFGEDNLEAFQRCAALPDWRAVAESGIGLALIPREQEYPVDVFSAVISARPEEDRPAIDQPQNLTGGSPDWAEIQPDPAGADIELTLEFERLLTGYLEFELIAPAGVIMDVLGFEAYQHGQPDYPWGMQNTLRYVTREGPQHYRSLVRRGWRYLKIVLRGLTESLLIRRVTGALSTFPAPRLGDFRCDDALLSRVYEISRWTTRMCMEDTFVDCPTYEQAYWVGDARNSGAVALLAYDARPLVRRSLRLAAHSLDRSPLVESQVPSAWQNIHTCWSMLWALACEEYYQFSGDEEFVREIYPAMARQARYGRDRMLNEQGLFISAFDNLLEWAWMDIGGGGQPTATTHLNAWFVESCRRTARLAEVLGRPEEAAEFREIADRVRRAINEWLWDETREAYIDCLHADGRRSEVVSEQTNTVCLLCRVAPPAREALIRHYVGQAPEGFVRACSPFMSFFTLEALARLGEHPRMLELMRETWGYMVENDATTCWENMPGWEETPRLTRSWCHAWSAAPAYFLPTVFLGIQPAAPGFASVRIAPRLAGLAWAEGRVPTPHGLIEVRWESAPRSFMARVKLPAAVAGELELPVQATTHGRLERAGRGLIRFEQRAGRWIAHLASGADVTVTAAK